MCCILLELFGDAVDVRVESGGEAIDCLVDSFHHVEGRNHWLWMRGEVGLRMVAQKLMGVGNWVC